MIDTMKIRTIVSGKSVLRKFLQKEQGNLSKSPILVISSALPKHSNTTIASVKEVDTACRKLQFYTGMEMGLRTVESHVTSVFPTVENVKTTLELAKRTGASTLIGVGSGAAMDLAKAVLQKSKIGEMTGILVPSTHGGILASTSSLPLLLDTREEALIVPEESNGGTVVNASEATVVIETNSLSDIYKKDALYTCLAIGLDALYRGQEQEGTTLLDAATSAINDDSYLPEALASAGSILSYGITGTSVRSSPLALAASLIPPSFPNAPMLTFIASLLPGMVNVMGSSYAFDETLVKSIDIPPLASLMVHADGAQSVPTLLSHVKENQALWKCFDIDDGDLEAILHHSLNR